MIKNRYFLSCWNSQWSLSPWCCWGFTVATLFAWHRPGMCAHSPPKCHGSPGVPGSPIVSAMINYRPDEIRRLWKCGRDDTGSSAWSSGEERIAHRHLEGRLQKQLLITWAGSCRIYVTQFSTYSVICVEQLSAARVQIPRWCLLLSLCWLNEMKIQLKSNQFIRQCQKMCFRSQLDNQKLADQ